VVLGEKKDKNGSFVLYNLETLPVPFTISTQVRTSLIIKNFPKSAVRVTKH